jgi:DNA polymerase-3 subunit beta
MRFSIQKEAVLKPLQWVIGAVEKRQTLPILANILIRSAGGNELFFVGTDLEVELTGVIQVAEPIESGEITVSARKLVDICRNLSNEAMISFDVQKDKLILSADKSRFTLLTLPASEFPSVDEVYSQMKFSLQQMELKRLLTKTYFSMGQQDVRSYLNGMLFDVTNEMLRVISADGHRLSLGWIKNIQTKESASSQIIVPRKGIVEIMHLLEDTEEKVDISISNAHLHVETAEFKLISKLIEGKFPDFNRVIPKNGNKIAIIDREKFKQALTRVSILSSEVFRGIRLSLTEKCLKIFANNTEQEEAEEVIDVDYAGPDLEIGFNVNYLIDICNVASSDKLKMTFADSSSSALIEDTEQANYTYVVMPMRI